MSDRDTDCRMVAGRHSGFLLAHRPAVTVLLIESQHSLQNRAAAEDVPI
jgi:hypothetical protein